MFAILVVLLTCITAYAESPGSGQAAKSSTGGSCVECHQSYIALVNSASDPTIASMAKSLQVSNKFIKSEHASKGCPSCHGGNEKDRSKEGAHKNMVSDPLSVDGGKSVCGECHSEIVDRHLTSLHYTNQGRKDVFFSRLSKDESTRKVAKECWNNRGCVDCHATCGTCHIVSSRLPWVSSGPKGLVSGHEFVRNDSNETQAKTCYNCHRSLAVGGFSSTDVHYKAGMNCVSCHNEKEMHGDGTHQKTMINSGVVTTECKKCHETLTGQWHSETHLNSTMCQACHSVPYWNCSDCHGWRRIVDKKEPAYKVTYMLKLGVDARVDNKLTVLKKAPVGEKMMSDDGVTLIKAEKLNTQSAWYPAAPHNVTRPKPNQEFCNRCHGPGTGLLKESDLQFPDYERKQIMAPRVPVTAP